MRTQNPETTALCQSPCQSPSRQEDEHDSLGCLWLNGNEIHMPLAHGCSPHPGRVTLPAADLLRSSYKLIVTVTALLSHKHPSRQEDESVGE